jgi:hypothetical protein
MAAEGARPSVLLSCRVRGEILDQALVRWQIQHVIPYL